MRNAVIDILPIESERTLTWAYDLMIGLLVGYVFSQNIENRVLSVFSVTSRPSLSFYPQFLCLSVCVYALIPVHRQHAPYTLTRRHALPLDREFNLRLHRSLLAVLTAYNDQYGRLRQRCTLALERHGLVFRRHAQNCELPDVNNIFTFLF